MIGQATVPETARALAGSESGAGVEASYGDARQLDSVAESIRRCVAALSLPPAFETHVPAAKTRRIGVLGEHSAKAAFINALLRRDVLDLVHGAGRMHLIEHGDPPSISCVGTGRMDIHPGVWGEIDVQPADWTVEVRVDAPILRDPPTAMISLELMTTSLSNRENWFLLQSFSRAAVSCWPSTLRLS